MKPITLHSRSIPPMRNSFLAIILFAALGLLSACGGGSGSGNPSDPPPAALTLSTSSLPTGQIGVAYSAVLAATGGTPPYMWSITSGTLPAGLMLNASTGAITGTPTQTVTSTTLTFQVADSGTPPATKSAKLTLTISSTAVGITISPKRAGLTVTQTLMVSATSTERYVQESGFMVRNRGHLFIQFQRLGSQRHLYGSFHSRHLHHHCNAVERRYAEGDRHDWCDRSQRRLHLPQ